MGTKYLVDGDDLTTIANHIRTKGGTSAALSFPSGFSDAIDDIESGGTDLMAEIYKHDGISKLLVDVSADEAANFYFKGDTSANRNLTIDWGDGSAYEYTDKDTAFSGYFSHAYAKAGTYLIRIWETEPYSGDQTKAFFPYLQFGRDRDNKDGYVALRAIAYGSVAYVYSNSYIRPSGRDDITDAVITMTDFVTGNFRITFQSCGALRRVKFMVDDPTVTFQLPSYLFNGCSQLIDVDLPDNVPYLDYYCFANCYSLRSITLPSTITSIKLNCFANCRALQEIDIPSAVTTIESSAFSSCLSLEKLIIRNTNAVVTASGDLFAGSTIASGTGYIYVPDALVDSYKEATNWSTYSAQIKGLSELE